MTSRVAAACVAALLLAAGAPTPVPVAAAAESPARRLPFDDDVPPPPPLPEPLDRRFRGEIESFDGDRVKLRWTWKDPAQLDDFEPFVPVRATVSGGFTVPVVPAKEGDDAAPAGTGIAEARGTGGIRLRLGMLSDIVISTDAVLHDPHDLGVVLSLPASSDESILCLVQDRLFTRFDKAAGNSTMINKLGGIPATGAGMTEFRYISRSGQPKLGKGHVVRFDVVRKGAETKFTVTPKGEAPVVLQGKDTDTPYTNFQPGLYVSGASADFGPLTIDGKIDREWCKANDVLPHVAGNLLHPGNRFAGAEKKAAEAVEHFVKQDAEKDDPKTLIAPSLLASIVGDVKLALVIRIRAAEALAASGEADGTVGDRVAQLLDAPDLEARVLAWRVLRPGLPWHFRYETDGPAAARREAALQIGDWVRNHADEESAGKVFVEGQWLTPSRADEVRSKWPKAWDLRTPHVRLRTNVSREWAEWTLAALEAGYHELTRVAGREPPKEKLPLSVLMFSDADTFKSFCNENGYESKAAWKRFADLDRGVAFDTFDRASTPSYTLGLLAKLYGRQLGGTPWPSWFEEGRASWFGNGDYKTSSWDGRTLKVGLPGQGNTIVMLSTTAGRNSLPPVADFLARDPRTLKGNDLLLWYAQAWALHAYLMGPAPEDDRIRFAEWQAHLEFLKPKPSEVEDLGRRFFLVRFPDLAEFEERFRLWVKAL